MVFHNGMEKLAVIKHNLFLILSIFFNKILFVKNIF